MPQFTTMTGGQGRTADLALSNARPDFRNVLAQQLRARQAAVARGQPVAQASPNLRGINPGMGTMQSAAMAQGQPAASPNLRGINPGMGTTQSAVATGQPMRTMQQADQAWRAAQTAQSAQMPRSVSPEQTAMANASLARARAQGVNSLPSAQDLNARRATSLPSAQDLNARAAPSTAASRVGQAVRAAPAYRASRPVAMR